MLLVWWSFLSPMLWAQPVPSSENCHFYLDLEKEAACWFKPQDDSNYLVEYGYKYCRIFKQKALSWEDARTQWVDQTALCLQEALVLSHPKQGCQQLESLAFDSHPLCYRKSGFCRLGIWQKTTIVMTAVGLDFLLKPVKSFYQTFRLLRDCISDVPSDVDELYEKTSEWVRSGRLSRELAASLFWVEQLSEENLKLYMSYFKQNATSKLFVQNSVQKLIDYKQKLERKK